MFKAAVLFELNKPLEIIDVKIPKLAHGQVLIKILYAGLCHSQVMEVTGGRGQDPHLPHMLGHEGVGEIVELGIGVTKVQVGDKVILSWIKGCGAEVTSAQYLSANGITINAGAITTFSEYSVISENRCFKLPPAVPQELGVLLGCAVPTGAGILFNIIKPNYKKNIAIIGLGGVGMSALLAARNFAPNSLIVVDTNQEKLQLASKLGASHCINPADTDPVQAIFAITANTGVDYAIEAAGLTTTIEQAFAVTRKNGGQCIFASHPPSGKKIALDPHHLISGKSIRGTWGGECNLDRDIPMFAEQYTHNKLPLEVLISNKYQLFDINNAIDDLKNHKIIRGVITMHA